MRIVPRLFLASVALVLLAGCEGNPLEVRRTSCPAVALVRNAASLTRFSETSASRATTDRQFVANLTALATSCKDSKTGAASTVHFDIAASGGAEGDIEVPYFVAVIKDGTTLLSKQNYVAHLRLKGPDFRGKSTEWIASTTPLVPLPPRSRRPVDFDEFAPPPKAAGYEILIGLQLSEAEAAYNISH